jgi:hypothetical protein
MKKCLECEVDKELEKFWKRNNRSSGYQTICSDCQNLKRRSRLEDPEKLTRKREQEKKSYEKNRKKRIEKVKIYQQNLSDEDREKRMELRRAAFRNSQDQKQAKLFYLQNVYDKKKIIANRKLNDALRRENIIKPNRCQICNEEKALDGHHADYEKPLEVIWVCRKCHMAIHKQKGRR